MGSSSTYAYDNWEELEARRKCPIHIAKEEKRLRAITIANSTAWKLTELLCKMDESDWHKLIKVKVEHGE